MIHRTIVFFLVGILSIVAFQVIADNVFLKRIYHSEKNHETYEDPVRNCSKPGLMCKNCTLMVYCMTLPNGTFTEQVVGPCGANETCSEATGMCSSDPNPLCELQSPTDFPCHVIGILPDPDSCLSYHICNGENGVPSAKSIKRKCPNGYRYDPKTTLCRLKFNGTCPTVVPKCNSLGQMGVLQGNNAIYYVCLNAGGKMTAHIFRCNDNELFDGQNCKSPPDVPTASDSNGLCKARGYFYDPMNCFKYYECAAPNATPLSRNCPTKQYFNTTSAYCHNFECYHV